MDLLRCDRVRPFLERLCKTEYNTLCEFNRLHPVLVDVIAAGNIRFAELTTTMTQLLEDLDFPTPSSTAGTESLTQEEPISLTQVDDVSEGGDDSNNNTPVKSSSTTSTNTTDQSTHQHTLTPTSSITTTTPTQTAPPETAQKRHRLKQSHLKRHQLKQSHLKRHRLN